MSSLSSGLIPLGGDTKRSSSSQPNLSSGLIPITASGKEDDTDKWGDWDDFDDSSNGFKDDPFDAKLRALTETESTKKKSTSKKKKSGKAGKSKKKSKSTKLFEKPTIAKSFTETSEYEFDFDDYEETVEEKAKNKIHATPNVTSNIAYTEIAASKFNVGNAKGNDEGQLNFISAGRKASGMEALDEILQEDAASYINISSKTEANANTGTHSPNRIEEGIEPTPTPENDLEEVSEKEKLRVDISDKNSTEHLQNNDLNNQRKDNDNESWDNGVNLDELMPEGNSLASTGSEKNKINMSSKMFEETKKKEKMSNDYNKESFPLSDDEANTFTNYQYKPSGTSSTRRRVPRRNLQAVKSSLYDDIFKPRKKVTDPFSLNRANDSKKYSPEKTQEYSISEDNLKEPNEANLISLNDPNSKNISIRAEKATLLNKSNTTIDFQPNTTFNHGKEEAQPLNEFVKIKNHPRINFTDDKVEATQLKKSANEEIQQPLRKFTDEKEAILITSLQTNNSKLKEELNEMKKLITEMKREKTTLEERLESSEQTVKALREQLEKENEKSIENSQLITKQETKLRDIEKMYEKVVNDHKNNILLLKAKQEKDMEALHAQVKDTTAIADAGSRISLLIEQLERLEQKIENRHTDSEVHRTMHLEAREKLVSELEKTSLLMREEARNEKIKLHSIVQSLEASQQASIVQRDEDRCRLREEHSRLEALQLTLTTEADIIRNDVAEQRQKLREERHAWEPYRREQEKRIQNLQDDLQNQKMALMKERESFYAQKKAEARENELAMIRIKEHEQRLKSLSDDLLKRRANIDEKALELQVNIDRFSTEKAEFDQERALLIAERKNLTSLAKRLEEKSQAFVEEKKTLLLGRDEAHETLQKANFLHAQAKQEKASAERMMRQIDTEQKKYRELRLEVAEQQSIMQIEKLKYRRGTVLSKQRKLYQRKTFGSSNAQLCNWDKSTRFLASDAGSDIESGLFTFETGKENGSYNSMNNVRNKSRYFAHTIAQSEEQLRNLEHWMEDHRQTTISLLPSNNPPDRELSYSGIDSEFDSILSLSNYDV